MKHKTKKLIVLGGPKCVGKSRLMRKCINLNSHMLSDHFQVTKTDWHLLTLNEIEKIPHLQHPNLVLHYDFIRPFLRGLKNYGEDHLLSILQQAEQIHFVTMWCPRTELISRVELRENRKLQRRLNDQIIKLDPLFVDSKLQRVMSLYHSRPVIWRIYQQWLHFIDQFKARYWVFESSLYNEQLVPFEFTNQQFQFLKSKIGDHGVVNGHAIRGGVNG